MKKQFFITFSIVLACVAVTTSSAALYYVDPKGSDANSGTSLYKPWQSLDKVNSTVFKPGDRILFKKGGIWTGTLTPPSSGSTGHPIVFSSYGTGAKPVISGFAQLFQWKSLGSGIYESACTQCGDAVNVVAVNTVDTPMGRFPNAGYLTIESHTVSTVIDSHLAGTQDWTGAEAVIRKERWVLDRNTITADNGATLTIKQGSEYPIQDGWGYFIQNSLATLDAQGEWYYNPVTKLFYMYFGQNDPSKYAVQVSTVDRLVNLTQSFITIDGLTLRGANDAAISVDGVHNEIIQNDDISLSGRDGITVNHSSNVTVQKNTITDSHNTAMHVLYENNYSSIKSNVIKNSGVIAGMGNYYTAISVEDPAEHITIDRNKITNTGYSAISFQGNHVAVTNNIVDTFTTLLDDGAGIYTWNDFHPSLVHTDRVITGNVIKNGIAAPWGTPDFSYLPSEGIYMDNKTDHVSISANTISHIADAGIYLHLSDPKGSVVTKSNTISNSAKKVWIDTE